MKNLALIFVLALTIFGCGKEDDKSNGQYTRSGYLSTTPGGYGNQGNFYGNQNNYYGSQWQVNAGVCFGDPRYCGQSYPQPGQFQQGYGSGVYLIGSDGRTYEIIEGSGFGNGQYGNYGHQTGYNQQAGQVSARIQAFMMCSQGRQISARVHSSQPIHGNIIYATRIDSAELDNCMRQNGMAGSNGYRDPYYPTW